MYQNWNVTSSNALYHPTVTLLLETIQISCSTSDGNEPDKTDKKVQEPVSAKDVADSNGAVKKGTKTPWVVTALYALLKDTDSNS